MKKCPFCKNEIESNATECPVCKMVLVEKIPSVKTYSSNTYTPPKENTKKQNTYTYTTPNKSSSPKKEFKFPKIGNGWIISIVGSLLLTGVLNYRGAPNPLPAPISNPTENTNTSIVSPKTPYRYLSNGTVLFSDPFSFNGLGILSISNGSGSDAVVKLISNSGKKVYSVYIRTNNSYSIKNIEDGIYRVLFSFGADWDSDQKKFLVNPNAEAFDDVFNFQTIDDQDGSQYKEYDITLNAVVGGKATTNPIDPSVFDKY